MYPATLHFSADRATVSLGGETLPLRELEPSLVSFLGLCVLEARSEGQRAGAREAPEAHWVQIKLLRELPQWKHLSAQGAYVRVERTVKRLEGLGVPLLVQPAASTRKKTKLVGLNPALVGAVTHAYPSLSAFRAALLGVPTSAEHVADAWPAQQLLTRAAGKFERGQYPAAAELCQQVLTHPACGPEQRLLALARLAWVENYTGGVECARQALDTLLAAYQDLGGDDAPELPARVKAQVYVQVGRYHLLVRDLREAARAYAQARDWIDQGGGAREWAAYHAGLVLIAVFEEQFDRAEQYARAALQYAIEGGWPWVQQIQGAYLGGFLLNRFVRAVEGSGAAGEGGTLNPDWRVHLPLLQEARSSLMQAHEIVMVEGYSQGPAELELMLSHAGRCEWWAQKLSHSGLRQQQDRRELERLSHDLIEVWLHRAQALLEHSGYRHDLPRVPLEWAEVLFMRGDLPGALARLDEAEALSAQYRSPAGHALIADDVQRRRRSMLAQQYPRAEFPRWK